MLETAEPYPTPDARQCGRMRAAPATSTARALRCRMRQRCAPVSTSMCGAWYRSITDSSRSLCRRCSARPAAASTSCTISSVRLASTPDGPGPNCRARVLPRHLCAPGHAVSSLLQWRRTASAYPGTGHALAGCVGGLSANRGSSSVLRWVTFRRASGARSKWWMSEGRTARPSVAQWRQ